MKIVNPHENHSLSLFEQIIGTEERTQYDHSEQSTPE